MIKNRSLLTKKQLQVLQLAAEGYAGKEIADKLNVTLRTVVQRKGRIFERLKAKSTPHAVWIAAKRGLLEEK